MDTPSVGRRSDVLQCDPGMLHRGASHIAQLLDAWGRSHDSRFQEIQVSSEGDFVRALLTSSLLFPELRLTVDRHRIKSTCDSSFSTFSTVITGHTNVLPKILVVKQMEQSDFMVCTSSLTPLTLSFTTALPAQFSYVHFELFCRRHRMNPRKLKGNFIILFHHLHKYALLFVL